jgi:hypothetical protein
VNAIIYNGTSGVVIGYVPNPDMEELNASDCAYDLVAEVPASVSSTPENHYVKRTGAGEYELVEVPAPPAPVTLEQRIADLEMALAELFAT